MKVRVKVRVSVKVKVRVRIKVRVRVRVDLWQRTFTQWVTRNQKPARGVVNANLTRKVTHDVTSLLLTPVG